MSAKVFVTGATGYVAGHIIKILLSKGYQVIGSVRSLKNEEKLAHLKNLQPQQNLTLVEGNLTDKECWNKNLAGCDYLMHCATPFPAKEPKDPKKEIIEPAVEGTENVLNAAVLNKIKKVVLTSSVASIFSGIDNKNFFTEKDWSNPSKSPAYEASKHLAEKKAMEIVEKNKQNGGNMELTVINPGFIQGPSLSPNNTNTSTEIIINLMTNKIPGLAKMSIGYVDVREVALAHVNAIEREKSNGKRYLLIEGSYWFEDVATMLREEFGQYGYKITSRVFGNCVLSFAAMFDMQARLMKPYVGRFIQFDNTASQQDLGIQYRGVRETLYDTVYEQIENKKIPNLLPKNHQKNYRTSQLKNY